MFKKYEKTIINVDGMSCVHCKNKIINTFKNIDCIKKVNVSLNKKQVSIVSNTKLTEEFIKKVIEDLDYIYVGMEK